MNVNPIHKLVNKLFRFLDLVLHKVGGVVDGESRFHLWWQNLNDEDAKKFRPKGFKGFPYHGRSTLWWNRPKKPTRRVGFGWNLWNPHWLYSFHIHFDGVGGDDDLSFGVGLWPFSFHVSFAGILPKRFQTWWERRYKYNGREIWVYATRDESMVGGINFVFNFWRNPDGGELRKTWRELYIHFPDIILSPIFGSVKHREELIEERDVKIPMPEGQYDGHVKLLRSVWKRPRLPFTSKVHHGARIDIPDGIPFEGKGENSWDCGEDGLFGCGADRATYEAAIARAVEITLESRRKNNGNIAAVYPHPEIRKKLIQERRAAARPEDNGVAG